MANHWLIYCPHCNKGTTIGISPRQVDYSKQVNCSLCNKVIDASNGVIVETGFCVRRKPREYENISLLSIG